MFGIGLKIWMKWAILAIYVGLVLLVYSQVGWDRINEIVRIPVIEYALVFVMALLISGGMWIARRIRGSRSDTLNEQIV
jgi:hypothetical protein